MRVIACVKADVLCAIADVSGSGCVKADVYDSGCVKAYSLHIESELAGCSVRRRRPTL